MIRPRNIIALLLAATAIGAVLSTDPIERARAQSNTQCSNRPAGDSSNACANTRFVAGAISAATAITQALTASHIFIGNASNIATDQALSGAGDCTASLSNAGVLTLICTKTNGTAFGTLATTTPIGTGVVTGINTAVSTAGGFPILIASGTKALGTTGITSATCAAAVTAVATGAASTDVADIAFNSDPTAVTGYAPSTSGMLTIIPWASSGAINIKVCNNTAATITPGAITLNWKIDR